MNTPKKKSNPAVGSGGKRKKKPKVKAIAKRLRELGEHLDYLAGVTDRITTGNVSHNLANLKASLSSSARLAHLYADSV